MRFAAVYDLMMSNRSLVVNTVILNQIIKKSPLVFAKAVFNKVKPSGKINVVTYTSLIDVAGKAGRLDLAQKVFEEAKKAKQINVVTYTSMLLLDIIATIAAN